MPTVGYMNNARYDTEWQWLSQDAEDEGRGSEPRRIFQPHLAGGEWVSCALLVGLVVALAWTLKVAVAF